MSETRRCPCPSAFVGGGIQRDPPIHHPLIVDSCASRCGHWALLPRHTHHDRAQGGRPSAVWFGRRKVSELLATIESRSAERDGKHDDHANAPSQRKPPPHGLDQFCSGPRPTRAQAAPLPSRRPLTHASIIKPSPFFTRPADRCRPRGAFGRRRPRPGTLAAPWRSSSWTMRPRRRRPPAPAPARTRRAPRARPRRCPSPSPRVRACVLAVGLGFVCALASGWEWACTCTYSCVAWHTLARTRLAPSAFTH